MNLDASPAAELLRSAVGRVGLASATDGELVRRYAAHRDDLAFAELVHRFAPAVYALCRRHLSDPGTADDAFQAVFVLLARKAGTLVHPDRVGGWLTGTADRVARTARRRNLRRSDRVRPLESVPEPAAESAPPSDLRTILDDELAKLPPHYQAVVLMCDVDGVSRREAAVRLKIPTATLGHRLTRARAVLGRRLLRRGVLVAAGAVASSGSVANPPSRLLASAVRVALSDTPPTELLPLLIPEMTPMPRGKLLMLLAVGLVLAGGVTTGVVLMMPEANTPPTTSETNPSVPTPPPQTPVTVMMSDEDVAKMPQPKPRLPQDRTGAFAFTQDGTRMVSAPNDWNHQDTKLVVYNTADWKPLATLDIVREDAIVTGMAITPDGKRVFITGFRGGNIRVWDVTSGMFEEKQIDIGDAKLGFRRIKLSPDGRLLVAFAAQAPERWYFRVTDAKTGDALRTIDLPGAINERFTFTDSGKRVAATVAPDDRAYFVTEWDLATGEEKRRIDVRKAVGADRGPPIATAVAYTADGKHVVVGGGFQEEKLKLSEVKPDQIVSNYPWSGSVWVIDRESGKLVKTLVDYHHDLVRGLHLTARK